MKNKLKYLLIMGAIFNAANASDLNTSNVSDENADPSGLVKSPKAIRSKANLTPLDELQILQLNNLKKGLRDKKTRLELFIADLEEVIKSLLGMTKAIASEGQDELKLNSQLMLNKDRLTEASLELYRCLDYINCLRKGTLYNISEAQSFVTRGTPKFTITDTTAKKALDARDSNSIKREAQQNCLGKVTAALHNSSDGKSPVIMTPSTTRPPKSKKVPAPRSPIFSLGEVDLSKESDDNFMLPAPLASVNNQERSSTPMPLRDRPLRSNTPRPPLSEL